MITGPIKNQIDQIWNAFWAGGISNPLEVIEQITYLLFLRRLDDLQTLEENKAATLKRAIGRRIFPEGMDDIGKDGGRPYEDIRWSRFKHFAAAHMFAVVGEHAFSLLRSGLAANNGGEGSTYAHHMKDARFTIPTPALLSKVVDLLDAVPMEERDTKGDVYEYMLGKIASAGQNGQFRTPRHIIRLMFELTAPMPADVICDPACGTAGFPVVAGEYLRERFPNLLHDAKQNQHFHHGMFHGFDFDNTMLRIGSMNMLLHGVENPDIRYRTRSRRSIQARMRSTRWCWRTHHLRVAWTTRRRPRICSRSSRRRRRSCSSSHCSFAFRNRAAARHVIVPDGVLFGSSTAHKTLRKILVEDQVHLAK